MRTALFLAAFAALQIPGAFAQILASQIAGFAGAFFGTLVRARIEYGGWGSTERKHRLEPADTVATAVGIGEPENTRANSSNRSIPLRAHRAHPWRTHPPLTRAQPVKS
jgi:hypothetical protein